jgi:UDP-N-acetylmuramate--alanine ligase
MNLDSLIPNSGSLIHIVGIGGIGMSGLAKLLQQNNYNVQGSDAKENQQTRALEKLGIKIFIGHNSSNVNGSQMVARSSAIKNDNVEIVAARSNGIPVILRAELLSNMLLDGYNICVTGAHGKTSTTSLIYSLLQQLNHSPTVICGGIINSIDSNAQKGNGNINVVEADESDGTFLALPTDIGVITNIDEEHLDYYKNIDNIINVCKLFVDKVLIKDLLVSCDDCQYLSKVNAQYLENPKYITYGIDSQNADIKAINIKEGDRGMIFDVLISQKFQQKIGRKLGIIKDVEINRFGIHNVLNTLAGIIVSIFKGGEEQEIKNALMQVSGVKRRFTIVGEVNGITFVDDYAHHPSEIQATLKMAQSYASKNNGKVFAIFQPHRYSRFKELYNQFLTSFENADYLLALDVYSAGENEIKGVNSRKFIDECVRNNPSFYCENETRIMEIIKKHTKPGDYVIFMGAGNISDIAYKIPSSILQVL